MKFAYETRRFHKKTLELINQSDEILTDLHARGFRVTLRTLYYQLVSRNIIENSEKSYDNLGKAVTSARRCGLIDWEHVVDQTRSLRGKPHSGGPGEKIRFASYLYYRDKWEGQHYRPEVWIEKDALAGIIGKPCGKLDVDFFACRGYTSESEMWGAAKRLQRRIDAGQTPVIFYLGDHDPSGLDMTRDVQARLEYFLGKPVEVHRLALNLDQVRKFGLPPNPTKVTDSRAAAYLQQFGRESWELDALDPDTLAELITTAVSELRDPEAAYRAEQLEETERKLLRAAGDRWDEVAQFLAAPPH